ncbi:MAG: aminopeptidase [Candidatus Diapherotrites archaeon]|nr:aminopeptidase [Candidatus Diapherotrites archaeon]
MKEKFTTDSGLLEGTTIAARDCLGIKSNEQVLIVSNGNKKEICEAFRISATELGASVKSIVFPPTGTDGAEPPKLVAQAMLECDVFFLPTTFSLTHTKARINANKNGARGLSLPNVSKEMFTGPIKANYPEIKNLNKKMKNTLDGADKIRITSPQGTLLSFSISGREIHEDDGDCRNPRDCANLPTGEIYAAPVEGTAQGTIVIESMGGSVNLPTKAVVKNGRVVSCQGKDAEALEKIFASGDENAKVVCEFGVGTNKSAKLVGNTLNDEKIFGSVHIGFGNNTSFGGKNASNFHNDGIILNPSVFADNKKLMENGEWLI